jgi:hypothetical protein
MRFRGWFEPKLCDGAFLLAPAASSDEHATLLHLEDLQAQCVRLT